jgi:hypothetical protein
MKKPEEALETSDISPGCSRYEPLLGHQLTRSPLRHFGPSSTRLEACGIRQDWVALTREKCHVNDLCLRSAHRIITNTRRV